MNVLVMGGTQFNGLALVRELSRHGHTVTILNRGRTEAELPLGVKRLIADRTDDGSVKAALQGLEFDCIFDVTAYRVEDVALMVDLFEGMTGHYVFIGSTVIYAESDLLPITEDFPVDRSEKQSEYGLNKLICEDFLIRRQRETGFPATIVSLSMVFGPRNILPDREQRMFQRLLSGRPILIPGDGRRLGQVGHVDDQAKALRLAMGNPHTFGKRYNLTGKDYFTAEGYVDTCARAVDVTPNKVFVAAELMDDLWDGRASIGTMKSQAKVDTRITQRPDEVARTRGQLSFLVQHTAPTVNRWNRSVVYSVERLRRDVGWEPEFTFPAAVEHTFRWFCQQGLDKTASFDFAFEDELLKMV
jgi:nucleoside-diphosphate-sugar epimerase|tara:strand:+ start:5056 stop:6132 length:1077 start_codon:yes stop_codon:yes gene_type:complete